MANASKTRTKTINGKEYTYTMTPAAVAKEIEANKRWQSENYEALRIMLPKGMRDQIHALADRRGVSMRALLIQMIQRELDADS